MTFPSVGVGSGIPEGVGVGVTVTTGRVVTGLGENLPRVNPKPKPKIRVAKQARKQ